MSELFGGVFQRTELSEALTEICKMDPTFDKERFLLECEYDMIPNVLEAMITPDLEVRKLLGKHFALHQSLDLRMSYIPRKLFVNWKFLNRAIFYYSYNQKLCPCVVKYIFHTGFVIIVIIVALAADDASVLPVIVGLKIEVTLDC